MIGLGSDKKNAKCTRIVVLLKNTALLIQNSFVQSDQCWISPIHVSCFYLIRKESYIPTRAIPDKRHTFIEGKTFFWEFQVLYLLVIFDNLTIWESQYSVFSMTINLRHSSIQHVSCSHSHVIVSIVSWKTWGFWLVVVLVLDERGYYRWWLWQEAVRPNGQRYNRDAGQERIGEYLDRDDEDDVSFIFSGLLPHKTSNLKVFSSA